MNEEMLKMCIQQGYAPSDCTLNGMIVFSLTSGGKNPCVGCHKNCTHNLPSKSDVCRSYGLSVEEVEHNKRLEKRHNIGTSKESILFVDTDRDSVALRVMNPELERCYILRAKNAHDAALAIPLISHKYNARQVFIDTNGYGIAVMDCLASVDVRDIDIIPMRCTSTVLDSARSY